MDSDDRKMVDELLDVESGLSNWELTFLDNLDANYERRELTENQHNKLLSIWDKVLG